MSLRTLRRKVLSKRFCTGGAEGSKSNFCHIAYTKLAATNTSTFSKPFDVHRNPAYRKGVLFDTNASYDIQGEAPWVQRMISQKRVSAYGDIKGTVDSLQRGDTVFYYQKGYGIIAAARITGTAPHNFENDDERYWDVEYLTKVPSRFEPPYAALSVAEIREITGLNFYWPKTIKVPYLTVEQSDKLLQAAVSKLGAAG